MARWVCPFWLFSSLRATDGLRHLIQITDVIVTNPGPDEATIELVFYEARNGGLFERSLVFGGGWRLRPQSQFAYRTDIRAFSGSMYGWFELTSDVNVVPHAALTRVLRQATDAGRVDNQSETTLHLERYPEQPSEDEPIPTIPGDPGRLDPGSPRPWPWPIPPMAPSLAAIGRQLIALARRLDPKAGRAAARSFRAAELFVPSQESERILRRDAPEP